MKNWLGIVAVVFFGVFSFALWWLLKLAHHEVGFWGPLLMTPPCLIVAWLVDRNIFRPLMSPKQD